LLGSLCIGVFASAYLSRADSSESLRLFFVVGLLGGFTTFSSFSLDMLTLLRNGAYTQFAIYSTAHFVGGLVLVLLGYLIGRVFVG
jgi:CrcB protein